MYELLVISPVTTEVKTEVLRNYHICQNFSHTEYEVTPNIRPKTKKAMNIFAMKICKNCVSGSFPFFKPHSSKSQVLRESPWQAYIYWFLPNTHRIFFLSEFATIWNYVCICLLIYFLSRLKPHEERCSAFFIYHSPLIQVLLPLILILTMTITILYY